MSYASTMLESYSLGALTVDSAMLTATVDALNDCAEACRRGEQAGRQLADILG
jgi:hypothetical protein